LWGSKPSGCICNLPTKKQIGVDIIITNKDGAATLPQKQVDNENHSDKIKLKRKPKSKNWSWNDKTMSWSS